MYVIYVEEASKEGVNLEVMSQELIKAGKRRPPELLILKNY
jgi:hypothetical protein